MKIAIFAVHFTAFVFISAVTIWAGSVDAPAGVMVILIGTALWEIALATYEAVK